MNISAIFHAYKFTHFEESESDKTLKLSELSFSGRLKTLFFGVNIPRPENRRFPVSDDIETVIISGTEGEKLEAWWDKQDDPKGTIVLFHGFSSEKSDMIDNAQFYSDLGYNTLNVDFLGSGGSTGNRTTIGFDEAEQVKWAVDFLENKGVKNIYLMGISMGAVAVMKSLVDYRLDVKGLILECPFGTLRKTVFSRFNSMGAPAYPMADLLVFWGGAINGFWGHGFSPEDIAKDIKLPTLLIYGMNDEKVSLKETNIIYDNLNGNKTLVKLPNSGHGGYIDSDGAAYSTSRINFLESINDSKKSSSVN